ncbi:aldo/keto reductase [Thomasclavelia spiroformis]|uniref:aldo/keto reductase n=1 Tax=Thomasclavelia spiroformis TaxID=29348 RepID=UPI0026DBD5AB|nr:aldo/keto reductase [Thomasclavelia spiroformis]
MMKLVDNLEIPDIGLGVYKISEKEMNEVISLAYQDGYKLFDTAQMYKNETALGEALKKNKISRKDIFLISKVDNCNQGYDSTIASFYDSLKKLKTQYLDSFLIHWPGLNKERMLNTWKALEYLYKEGLVKSIGVCNFEKSQLEFILDNCEIAPMINQIEHTPFMHDETLISFCKKNNIQIMAWGPLLRGNMEDPRIMKIASKYQKSPAQLLIRWNIQQGIIPIPKSKNPSRLLENISVFDFDISLDDIHELNQMNQNIRTSYNPLEFDF